MFLKISVIDFGSLKLSSNDHCLQSHVLALHFSHVTSHAPLLHSLSMIMMIIGMPVSIMYTAQLSGDGKSKL